MSKLLVLNKVYCIANMCVLVHIYIYIRTFHLIIYIYNEMK